MSKFPKCPKCKSQDIEIIEIWSEHSISWKPGFKFGEGALDPGDPIRVEGHCINCKKYWRMRGIIQVDPKWFSDEEQQP